MVKDAMESFYINPQRLARSSSLCTCGHQPHW